VPVSLVSSFYQSTNDPGLFIKELSDGEQIWITTYVDDLLTLTKETANVKWIVEELSKRYKIKFLGLAKSILGTVLRHGEDFITLQQTNYLEKLEELYKQTEANNQSVPIQLGLKLATEERGETVKH
jgi:hypothetical protein